MTQLAGPCELADGLGKSKADIRVSDVVWQDEVDVVCTDVGPAGLLCALAASAGGGEVMIAAQRRHSRTWFETLRGDAATAAYTSALVDDIGRQEAAGTAP